MYIWYGYNGHSLRMNGLFMKLYNEIVTVSHFGSYGLVVVSGRISNNNGWIVNNHHFEVWSIIIFFSTFMDQWVDGCCFVLDIGCNGGTWCDITGIWGEHPGRLGVSPSGMEVVPYNWTQYYVKCMSSMEVWANKNRLRPMWPRNMQSAQFNVVLNPFFDARKFD